MAKNAQCSRPQGLSGKPSGQRGNDCIGLRYTSGAGHAGADAPPQRTAVGGAPGNPKTQRRAQKKAPLPGAAAIRSRTMPDIPRDFPIFFREEAD